MITLTEYICLPDSIGYADFNAYCASIHLLPEELSVDDELYFFNEQYKANNFLYPALIDETLTSYDSALLQQKINRQFNTYIIAIKTFGNDLPKSGFALLLKKNNPLVNVVSQKNQSIIRY